jgi:alcohol dehydrogenase (NADP+)
MYKSKAYSAASATSPLASTTISRRDPTDRDVQMEILFCGICHSDLHAVRNEWSEFMSTAYPIVPGHEIVGRVTKVGSAVTRFRPGDLAAVGCLVDSDRTCPHCRAGLENFCPNLTLTFGTPDKHGTAPVTYGGYSDSIVVDEHFVLSLPANLDLAGAAPLLCAGITTYSPMRHWGVTEGKKVGVVGLGGLGHMGVKFARALWAHVVVFTTSPGKAEDALRLGADEVVVSRDANAMQRHAGSFDFILERRFSPGVIGSQFSVQKAGISALLAEPALSVFQDPSPNHLAGRPIVGSGFLPIPKPRAPQGLASHPLSDRAPEWREAPRIT